MDENQIRDSVRNPRGQLCVLCTDMVGSLWPMICDNMNRTHEHWRAAIGTRAVGEFHASECQMCACILHCLRTKTRKQPADQVTALEVGITMPINANTSLEFRGLPTEVDVYFRLRLSATNGTSMPEPILLSQ